MCTVRLWKIKTYKIMNNQAMPDTIQSNSINSHYTQNRNKMKLFKAYLFASVSIMWILEREDMMVFGKNLNNPSILCSWPMEIIMLNLWGLNVADSLLLVLELENTWSNFIYIETNNLMNTPNILFQLILIILMYNVLYSTYMTIDQAYQNGKVPLLLR